MKLVDLQAWSVQNWNRLCEDDRKRCVKHLWTCLMRSVEGPGAIANWRRQVARGEDIGSDDAWFHFRTGMWVRNRLRDVLMDDKLPGVIYPPRERLDASPAESVELVRNWDDYYIGALVALAKEVA